MTTVLLALGAALAYGASDFIGGRVSRRASAWAVAFVVQLTSAVSVLALALALPQAPATADLAWGAVAGLGSGVGIAFLFRGFAAGRMSVVAPLSAVGAAVIPVLVELLLGERPGTLVLLGVLVALPGIWMVSRAPDASTSHDEPSAPLRPGLRDSGVLDGALAGVGFAGTFLGLAQVGAEPGWWPLVVSQTTSVVTVVLLATALGAAVLPIPRPAWAAWPGGPLGSTALALFGAASGAGMLTVAVVLTSLYPATTIALAVLLLGERISRLQGVGLLLCGVTVVLVAAG